MIEPLTSMLACTRARTAAGPAASATPASKSPTTPNAIRFITATPPEQILMVDIQGMVQNSFSDNPDG
ncbi:MAG: hypothetical protein WC617_07295 [Rhodanobacter sp.]